jgi:hypothetical protein
LADIFQGRDAAARQRLSIHDAGVELHRADGVAEAAVADRMHAGIVLDGARAASSAGLSACKSAAAVFTAVCPNGQVARTT